MVNEPKGDEEFGRLGDRDLDEQQMIRSLGEEIFALASNRIGGAFSLSHCNGAITYAIVKYVQVFASPIYAVKQLISFSEAFKKNAALLEEIYKEEGLYGDTDRSDSVE